MKRGGDRDQKRVVVTGVDKVRVRVEMETVEMMINMKVEINMKYIKIKEINAT